MSLARFFVLPLSVMQPAFSYSTALKIALFLALAKKVEAQRPPAYYPYGITPTVNSLVLPLALGAMALLCAAALYLQWCCSRSNNQQIDLEARASAARPT